MKSHFLNGAIYNKEVFITSSAATLCTRLHQQGSKLMVLVSKSASLPTTLKLFFAANISTAFPPSYVNCFDVYFILLKIFEVFTIKSCSVYFISYRQMNHFCIEYCSYGGQACTEWDMFLRASLHLYMPSADLKSR